MAGRPLARPLFGGCMYNHPHAHPRLDVGRMGERAPLHLTVSPRAHDGWRSFCQAHGATMTALAESIGLALASLDDPDEELPDAIQQVLRGARQIDAARRRRT